MQWLLASPLLRRSHFGQRLFVGEENVHHPWMERLDDAQGLGWDLLIISLCAAGLVPSSVGLHEVCMDTKRDPIFVSTFPKICVGHFL